MKHPVQNDNKTTTAIEAATAKPLPAVQQVAGKKIGQFTITIVQNQPSQCDNALKRFAPYERQMAILKELGFQRLGMCFAMLKKCDGDVGKAAEQLFIRKKNREETARKASTIENPETHFAQQIAALEEKGFKWRKMMINLLVRFDGDIEKVAEVMEKRRSEREAKLAAKAELAAEEAITNSAIPEGSNVDPEVHFADQIAQLQSRGFKWKKMMVTLLTRFDGDVEKVAEVMEQRRKLREAKKAVREARTAPAVDVVEEAETTDAPEGSAPPADAPAPTAADLNEHELRVKLMEKFNGNEAVVDRVMARRKAQAEKRKAQTQNRQAMKQIEKEQRLKLKKERQEAKMQARKEHMAQKRAAKQAKQLAKAC